MPQALPATVQSLSLAGCDLVTGRGLARLTRLQTLRLSSCPKITPAAMQARQGLNSSHLPALK